MRQYDDLLIDTLLDYGFSVEEALRLIRLQERLEQDRRALWEQQMARWLSGTGQWDQHDHLN
ncbi:MAG TPA: hypothetical protein VGN32_04050 [Ktedonobacterales bacterium]|jgi:type II secretory pathway component PulF|nr:hypothetical protein [Ktedonobacterales bacterium]